MEILSLDPSSGSVLGGTSVVVTLQHGFGKYRPPLRCGFGEAGFSASTWLDATTVVCISPPSPYRGKVLFYLRSSTTDEPDFGSTTSYWFFYPPTVSFVHPLEIETSSSTPFMLTITGGNFVGFGSLSCRFGETIIGALWISDAVIECPFVAALPGEYEIEVSNNMADFTLATTIISYVAGGRSNSSYMLSPTAGPIAGGTVVSLAGAQRLVGPLLCLFGDQVTSALWTSSAEIECCRSPARPPGYVTIALWSEGNEISTGDFALLYALLPIVSKVSPVDGFADGDMHVNVYGHNFLHSQDLACRFGDEKATHIEWLSTSQIQCTTPKLLPGVTHVMVSLDGVRFSTLSRFSTYAVHQNIVLDRVDPVTGHAGGGTVVEISGTNFPLIGGLECLFGDEASPAMVLSETSLECVSPRLSAGTVVLELQHVGGGGRINSGETQAQFRVTSEEPMVQLVLPPSGPVEGGTNVVIAGFFPWTTKLVCRFCGRTSVIDVMAKWLSPSAVTCRSPRWHQSELAVAIDLLLEGRIARSTRNESTLFDFNTPPMIEDIDPRLGSASGGTEIRVRGANFHTSSTLACLICKRETDQCTTVSAVCLSPRELSCITPQHEPGLTAVRLTFGGFNSTTTAFFLFSPAPHVTNVHPRAGGTEGGTRVLVSGTNLALTEAAMCRFGDVRTKAAFAAGDIVCASPRKVTPEKVFLEVSVNGVDFTSDRFVFDFVGSNSDGRSIFAEPSYGDRRGGTQVVVYTETPAFETVTGEGSYECLFDDVVMPARVVSASSVRCPSPPFFVEHVANLSVRSKGERGGTAATSFAFLPAIEVHSLHPASVQPAGGDSIIVHGAGFRDTSSACCRFGDITVPAELLSITMLRCFAFPSQSEHQSLVCSSLADSISGSQTRQVDANERGGEVSPRCGPVQGGSLVQISGFNPHQDGLFCSFAAGDKVVLATASPVAPAGTVQCPTPPWPNSGTVVLQLTSDETGTLIIPTLFSYYLEPVLHGMEPSRGTTQGQTMLHIITSGTSTLANSTCGFFDSSYTLLAVSPAVWTTKSDVWCRSPIAKPGRVFVEVSLNGVDFTRGSGLVLTTTRGPNIFGVEPLMGTSTGGTEIAVRGIAFEKSNKAVCHFGGVGALATVVDDKMMVCTAPPASRQLVTTPTKVAFFVTLNDQEVSSSTGALLFTYSAYPIVSAVSPKTGSIAGGTSISVKGENFVDRGTGVECMFGAVATPATVASPNLIVCDSPPHHGAEVTFAVRNEGGRAFLLQGGPSFVFNASLRTPMGAALVPTAFSDMGVGSDLHSTSWNNSDQIERGTDQMECTSTEVSRSEGFYVSGCNVIYSIVKFITPENGPRVGGTPIVVTGLHFVGNEAFTCRFGPISTGGYVVDTTHLICSSPPSSEEKAVPFHVTRNGQPLQSNDIFYYFKDAPVIVHVQPRLAFQGSVATDIVVTGEGLRNSSSLACLLAGENIVQAKFLSDESAVCSVPQHVGYTGLQITNNGLDEKLSSVEHLPHPSIRLRSVRPAFGASEGGTIVFVGGSNLSGKGKMVCRFSNARDVVAQVLNDSTVQCVSPTNEAGEIRIRIGASDGSFSEESLAYTYILRPTVSNLQPSAGDVHGGTQVTIHGSDFANVTDLECYFGSQPARKATYVSAEQVICESPPSFAPTVVPFTMHLHGVPSTSSLNYRYVLGTTILDVSPRDVHLDEARFLTVTGVNFNQGSGLRCIFNVTHSSLAQWLSPGLLHCPIPVTLSPGAQAIGVTMTGNEQDKSTSSVSIIPRPRLTIHSVSPAKVHWDRNTPVVLIVEAHASHQLHEAGDELYCMFDDQPVVAFSSLAPSGSLSVICVSPPWPIHSGLESVVKLELILDGLSTDIGSSFIYSDRAKISAITPHWARDNGGTEISIRGIGFSPHSRYSCIFTDEMIPPDVVWTDHLPSTTAVRLSDQNLLCESPSRPPGPAFIAVAADRERIDISLEIAIRSSVQVNSFSPLEGTVAGGTIMDLTGDNFFFSGSMMCRIGSTDVLATFVSPHSLLCVTPPSAPGRFPVSIAMDGEHFEDTGLSFHYLEEMTVMSVTPVVGWTTGGTNVTLRVAGLKSHGQDAQFLCQFGSHRQAATRVNVTDESMVCSAPAQEQALQGAVHSDMRGTFVSVVDSSGVTSKTSTDLFSFVAPATVTAVVPDRGPPGTNVHVLGENFDDRFGIECMFGNVRAQATLVTSGRVYCRATGGRSGQASVNILTGGALTAWHARASFKFEQPIVLLSLEPESGRHGTSTAVTIRGRGFQPSADLLCLFGEREAFATVVSSTEVRCDAPPHGRGRVRVSLSAQQGHSSLVSLFFSFLSPPVVRSIHPQKVHEEGGTRLVISGENFVSSQELACKFSAGPHHVLVPAQFQSPTKIRCITPGWSDVMTAGVKVVVDVTVNGVDFTSGGAAFMFQPVAISTVWPSTGSASGGTPVALVGSSLPREQVSCCSFGGVIGSATFLSDVAVQCVAPRHVPAEVLLEVSNDGAAFSASGVPFQFHSAPSIFSVDPPQGSIEGSTLVTITGSNFKQSSNVTCRFGDTVVPGRYLSSNQVECWSPPMEHLSAVVEVQV
ncbi:unnamed protein product, partial [Scytosiphon promiscuus]